MRWGGLLALSSLLGERWKALSDDERRGYQESAAKDKARYEAEMALYAPPVGTAKTISPPARLLHTQPLGPVRMRFLQEIAAGGGAEGRRALRKPRKASSAYSLFLQSLPSIDSESGGKTDPKLATEQWRQLSPEARAPFEEQAALDHARYVEELVSYYSSLPAAPAPSAELEAPGLPPAIRLPTLFEFFSQTQSERTEPAAANSAPVEISDEDMQARWAGLGSEARAALETRMNAEKVRLHEEWLAAYRAKRVSICICLRAFSFFLQS
jgi:hypothetical protein